MIKKLDYKFAYKDRTIEGTMEIDLSRFDRQYSQAQYLLDSMVMDSMVPFMPMQTGTFVNQTRAMSQAIAGSGKVIAAAPPMGRFLYEGETMVDPATGSPWAAKGAKKVLVSQYAGKTAAKEDLQFSKHAHPKAQAHWFDAAKEKDGKIWLEKVKKVAGGGTNGR